MDKLSDMFEVDELSLIHHYYNAISDSFIAKLDDSEMELLNNFDSLKDKVFKAFLVSVVVCFKQFSEVSSG